MKKELFFLSSACFLLCACEMDKPSVPGAKNGSVHAVETEADRAMTQKIRQNLMDDDSLSTNAKNIKIITHNGVVTLRGTVNSEREKTEIGNNAKAVIGVKSVDNQLEVTRTDKSGAPLENMTMPKS